MLEPDPGVQRSGRPPNLSYEQVVLGTLVVTAVAIAFWLLLRFHGVLLLFLAAIILSTALKPGVAWLEQRHIPKTYGILIIYAAVFLLAGLLLWLGLPKMAEQGTAITQALADGYETVVRSLRMAPNILVQRLLAALPGNVLSGVPEAAATETTTGEMETALPLLWRQAGVLFKGLLGLVVVFILTFYWVLEGERLKQMGYLLVPMRRREQVRALVRDIEFKVGRYLLGQGLLVLIIAVMAFVAYTLIGLPNALLLAVIAGLMEAVPVVGPLLGAVPAAIIALSISPAAAVWVLVATVVIQQLENNLLVPRVMDKTVGVRPLVTLLALLALGSLFGVWGALIALPLAAVVQLLLDRFIAYRDSHSRDETGRDRVSRLRVQAQELVTDVRQQIRHKEEATTATADLLEDEVEAIALDLANFLNGQDLPALDS